MQTGHKGSDVAHGSSSVVSNQGGLYAAHGSPMVESNLGAALTPVAPGSPASLSSSSTSTPPRHFRDLPEIYDATMPIELEYSGLCIFAMEEPVHFEEANKHECWRREMQEELSVIQKNHTWQLADLLAGQQPVGLKWVFKLKKDSQGAVVKHKTRLIAKGCRSKVWILMRYSHRLRDWRR